MDKRIYTAMIMMAACLQVACGGDSKDEKMAKFMAECQRTVGCVPMYQNAANNTQIQGLAAQAGLTQVVATGSTAQQGQVVSTAIVPASITDAQVKAAAAKVQTQLSALNSQQSSTAPASTATSTSNYTPASAVEVGVTRLNSNDVLPSSTGPMRNPSSLQPASAQTPVAQQEESPGGAAAGQ